LGCDQLNLHPFELERLDLIELIEPAQEIGQGFRVDRTIFQNHACQKVAVSLARLVETLGLTFPQQVLLENELAVPDLAQQVERRCLLLLALQEVLLSGVSLLQVMHRARLVA
jgi:hypothetical protein